jgi:hypothetical protein
MPQSALDYDASNDGWNNATDVSDDENNHSKITIIIEPAIALLYSLLVSSTSTT